MGIKVRLIEELRVPLLSNLRIVPSLQDILNQRSVMLDLQKETRETSKNELQGRCTVRAI